jgi:hypothetical protein
MKNIHLLPTEKPSKLYKQTGTLMLDTILDTSKDGISINQNIYITSNEKIKVGDWFLNTLNGKLDKCDDLIYEKNVNHSNWCKKIILTDNPDLIDDGVQCITNTFAEWFVKNPSCEFVEVKKGFADGTAWGYNFLDYKIIIPQEEPNKTHYLDELPNMDKNVLAKMWADAMPKLEPKQETLELPKEIDFANEIEQISEYDKGRWYGRIEGAKWQAERSQMIVPPDATNIEVFAIKPDENGKLFAYIGYKTSNGNFEFSTVPFTEPKPERMYSEEEVIELLRKYRYDLSSGKTPNIGDTTKCWFEKFKKK